MAVINEIAKLGDVFSLGHWGDVLFDSECLKDDISEIELIQLLKKKVLKRRTRVRYFSMGIMEPRRGI